MPGQRFAITRRILAEMATAIISKSVEIVLPGNVSMWNSIVEKRTEVIKKKIKDV